MSAAVPDKEGQPDAAFLHHFEDATVSRRVNKLLRVEDAPAEPGGRLDESFAIGSGAR
jgi:hypothetical protein